MAAHKSNICTFVEDLSTEHNHVASLVRLRALRCKAFSCLPPVRGSVLENVVALTIGTFTDVSEKFTAFIRTAQFENGSWKILRNACKLLPTTKLLSVPL